MHSFLYVYVISIFHILVFLYVCFKLCELNEELYSVQVERDSLISAQANATEENQSLGEKAEKAREEIVKIGSLLADAELKEAQLIQQHTETTEQLTVVQRDLERLTMENGRILGALEEANQTVSLI